MSATLIELFDWWAIERADQPAVVAGSERLTHGELNTWTNAIADWFVASGLEVGDRVTVMAVNSLEWCVMAHAVMRAGGLIAPVNPRFTISELSYMLGRYQPKFIFFDAARSETADALRQLMPAVRIEPLARVHEFRHVTAAPVERAITPDTPVVIIPTSGSTGYPKGVVYSHRTMVGYVSEFALAEARASEHPRLLIFGPMSSSAGYVVFNQTMAYGGTAYMEEAFDAEKALQRIVDEKITMLQGTPIFFERIAACPGFVDADLSSIRLIQTGGARVSQQLLQTWMNKGVVLRQIYGQTEAGGTATINSIAASVSQPEKCGRGLPFTRLAIVDPVDGTPCPPHVPGEILIKGPGVMAGYWDDPETTAKTLVNGWLHTGDLGVVDENGLLTMLDRLKDIIISGGLNISAAEVERVISEFPGIEEVAVIAARDDRFGETPLAVIYARTDIDVPALVAHCGQHLSDYKVVRYVALHMEPLPRLATGKISKPELRRLYADAHTTLTKVR